MFSYFIFFFDIPFGDLSRILSECILTFYFGILLGLLFSRLSGIPSGDMEVWLSRSPQHVQLAMWSSVPMLCAILAHQSVTNVYPSSKGNILSFRAHARMVSFGGLCENSMFFFKTNFWWNAVISPCTLWTKQFPQAQFSLKLCKFARYANGL